MTLRNRLSNRIFRWANSHAENKKRNWNLRVHTKYRDLGLQRFIPIDNSFHASLIRCQVREAVFDSFKEEWSSALQRPNSKSGNGGNKLRVYSTFKVIYETERYNRYRDWALQ